MSSFTNIWMPHSALAMAHTRSADTQPAESRSRRPRGARQERGLGFRSAQNAPPYGLRWAPLQPTPLSCRGENKTKTECRSEGTRMSRVFVEMCSELRPIHVLQKAAIFTC